MQERKRENEHPCEQGEQEVKVSFTLDQISHLNLRIREIKDDMEILEYQKDLNLRRVGERAKEALQLYGGNLKDLLELDHRVGDFYPLISRCLQAFECRRRFPQLDHLETTKLFVLSEYLYSDFEHQNRAFFSILDSPDSRNLSTDNLRRTLEEKTYELASNDLSAKLIY